MPGRAPAAPRCAAIVGPYLSGKTSLLESLLFATGAITRKGNAKDGTLAGDSSPEAKARKMSVETGAAVTQYLDETWSFLDCPGSVELAQDARNALLVCDVAIVVAEPAAERVVEQVGEEKTEHQACRQDSNGAELEQREPAGERRKRAEYQRVTPAVEAHVEDRREQEAAKGRDHGRRRD